MGSSEFRDKRARDARNGLPGIVKKLVARAVRLE